MLIEAARSLLGLTREELCRKAGVPLAALHQIEEAPGEVGIVSEQAIMLLRSALEAEGIQFLVSGDVASGPGVALAGASQNTVDVDQRETIQYPEFLEGDGGPGSGG